MSYSINGIDFRIVVNIRVVIISAIVSETDFLDNERNTREFYGMWVSRFHERLYTAIIHKYCPEVSSSQYTQPQNDFVQIVSLCGETVI